MYDFGSVKRGTCLASARSEGDCGCDLGSYGWLNACRPETVSVPFKIGHENYYQNVLQDPAHHPRPGDAAQGKTHAAERHRSPAGRAAERRSAMSEPGFVPIQDLPVLHESAAGDWPAVTQHQTR